MRTEMVLTLLALVAACNDGDEPFGDAGRPDATLDAGAGDAAPVDAGLDAAPVDAPMLDAGPVDGAPPDVAAPTCEVCETPSPCQTATCVAGECIETPLEEGTGCTGDVPSICVAGHCVARGCGDGFVEGSESCDDGNTLDGDACSPGCESRRFAIAARPGQADSPQSRPTAASDGRGEVLVVWAASQPARRYSIMARRYTAAGVAQGPAFVVDDTLYDGWDAGVTVAGLAEGWALAWSAPGADAEGAGIALRRVLGDGTLIMSDRANQVTSGDQRSPALLGWPRPGLRVAWVDGSQLDSRIRWRHFNESLEPLTDEKPLGKGVQPALAGAADGWAAVWTTNALGFPSEVRAQVFIGEQADGPAVTVSMPSMDRSLGSAQPAIVAGSDGYVIAWTRFDIDVRGDVWTRRLGGEPEPLAAQAGKIEQYPVLGRLGTEVVALVHEGSSSSIQDVRLFASSTGPAAYLAGNGRQQLASFAWVPSGLWVLWSDSTFLSTADSLMAFVIRELPNNNTDSVLAEVP